MQPQYLTYDVKKREEFLSQRGTFSPAERDIFHRLCQAWQEHIPYERFAATIQRIDGLGTSDLVTLMNKLSSERCGILRTTIRDGQRVRHTIVLTEPDSPTFYRERADEAFVDMLESVTNPLPLLSTWRTELGELPIDAVRDVGTEDLSALFAEGAEPEPRVLAIATLGGDRILMSHQNVRGYVHVAMHRLRYYLTNTTLLSALAKLVDSSLIQLKKNIAAKDPTFWLQLCTSIVTRVREIEAMRIAAVDRAFFHSAYLLRLFLEAQIASAESRKKQAEEQRLDLDAIAMAVREAPEKRVTSDQLERLLEAQRDKYGEEYDSFRSTFFDQYVQSKGSKNLPRVVNIAGGYMHRDNLVPLFLQHHKLVEAEIRPHFTHLMEQQLRGSARPDSTFSSIESFDAAVSDYVKEHSDLLMALIARPALLAEALIYHAKQNKLVNSVDDLKQRLALYFDPDTMKPLPLHQWFNLRIVELFELGFARLHIVRRIWSRITGKYEALRNTYGERSVTEPTTVTTTAGEREADRRREERGAREAPSRRGESGSQRSAGAARRPTGRPPARPASQSEAAAKAAAARAKRGYSRKQVDTAWEAFGNTLKKKD